MIEFLVATLATCALALVILFIVILVKELLL